MIKRALVYAYGKTNHDTSYRAAAHFAAKHDCELTGVFVTPDYLNFATVYGEEPIDMARHFHQMQKEFEDVTKKSFTKITQKIGCDSQWHALSEVEARSKAAIYTDIIFVSQPSTEASVVFNDSDFVDHLVLDTGIPVIVIPENWTSDSLGVHPVLGWNESREAVAAVRHSLPLLKAAKQVDIVTVVPKFDDEQDLISGIEISAYLSTHGVECKFHSVATAAEDRNEAPTLQRHATVHECDMIIIGGYGHSRFREIVLGGVTRSLIRKSEVPILLAH